MNADARGQGGDGSPRLDLDAIEARQKKRRRYCAAYTDTGMLSRSIAETDAVLALVRRLQQENEELRAANAMLWHDLYAQEDERDALRGRVEELTEALAALVDACELWAGEDMPDGQTLLPRRVARTIGPARAVLAKVVPT